MKFFAVFAAIVAVACASPSGWTLTQLSEAIESPHTSAAYRPYLEQALNEMMAAIFAGQQVEAVTVTIPSMEVPSMSLEQISAALQNPETNPALVPYLEDALNQMMDAIVSDLVPVVSASAPISVPAMDITSWTLSELSEALQSPFTSPALVPYLESALNQMMNIIFAGEQMNSVVVAIPAGLLDAAVDVPIVPVMPVMPEMPTPVEVAPIDPTPIVVAPVSPTPVSPAPVNPTPAVSSSPLVQIIINIKQQEESVVAPAPVVVAPVAVAQPEIIPEPVHIVEHAPIVAPEAISIVDQAPEAISIVDQAPIVVESPVAAVPIGVVNPITPVFPVGVVAPAA